MTFPACRGRDGPRVTVIREDAGPVSVSTRPARGVIRGGQGSAVLLLQRLTRVSEAHVAAGHPGAPHPPLSLCAAFPADTVAASCCRATRTPQDPQRALSLFHGCDALMASHVHPVVLQGQCAQQGGPPPGSSRRCCPGEGALWVLGESVRSGPCTLAEAGPSTAWPQQLPARPPGGRPWACAGRVPTPSM